MQMKKKNAIDLGEYDMVVNVTSTTYLADGRPPFQYGSISYRRIKLHLHQQQNDMSSFCK